MVKLLFRICASYAKGMPCLLWLVYVNLYLHHHSANALQSNKTTNPPPQSRMTTMHTDNAGFHHNLTAWLYQNSSKFGGQLRCGSDVPQKDQEFAHFIEWSYENRFPYNVKIGCTLGAGRNGVDVVMGLPTAKRPENVTYLHVTLRSLLGHVLPRNEERIAIVVFVVESDDAAFVLDLLENIYVNFTRQIHNGMLQVITSGVELEPTEYLVPDAGPLLEWTTKQNLHAAYVMNFCKDKGELYLMLEDDVMAAVGYGEAIFEFLRTRNTNDKFMWASTAKCYPDRSDCSLGKLIPKDELRALLIYFLAKRFSEMPIASMMEQYLTEYRNSRPYIRAYGNVRIVIPNIQEASIIKHIGRQPSSPVGRTFNVRMSSVYADLYGADEASFNKPTPNPEARLMPARDQADFHFTPADSSTAAERFFEAIYRNPLPYLLIRVPAPKVNRTIRIDFVRVQRVVKILVKTGRPLDGAEKLDVGCAVLKYCQVIECVMCATFYPNGEAECRLDGVEASGFVLEFICDFDHAVGFRSIHVAAKTDGTEL